MGLSSSGGVKGSRLRFPGPIGHMMAPICENYRGSRVPGSPGTRTGLNGLEIGRRFFAAVFHNIVADFLVFLEARHPSLLNCRNMDEYILAAVLGLDKAETLSGVKPLYCTDRHDILPSM